MDKLVIIDLEKNDHEIFEKNCFYINCNKGNIIIQNGKKILFSKFKNYDKKSRFYLVKSLKHKIRLLNEDFFQELELFNLRNDKVFSISKVINFIKLRYFLKKKNFKSIKLITDNPSTIKVFKSFNLKIIIHHNKKTKKKFNFIFLKITKFYLKALLVIIYIKFKNKLIPKVKKELFISIYPNFFLKDKENFYKKKNISLLNFLITDETHLSFSFFKIISTFNKIVKSNILIAEQFIEISDVFKCYFNTLLRYFSLKGFNKSFEVNKIDLNDFYVNNFNTSFINRSKLDIYNNALKKIIKIFKVEVLNLYLFEYAFGFYLIKKFKQNDVYVKGYQHGIFSNKLFWFDLISDYKKYLPDEIISSNEYSYKNYLKIFDNKINIILKNKKKPVLLKDIQTKYKKFSKNILVFPGTHDVEDLFIYINNLIFENKNIVYFFKFHPKNKFMFKETKNIKIIKNIKKITYKKIIVSSTSTLVYDLNKLNISKEVFTPDYKLNCY